LKAAEAAGLSWPDIAQWSDDQVMQSVVPSPEKRDHRNQSPEPDYAATSNHEDNVGGVDLVRREER